MKKIDTATEAASLNDISEEWKIVAKRHLRTVSGEIAAIWEYCGSLSDSKENLSFRKLAFATARRECPHISCVTGRDAAGILCLYARIFPVSLRSSRARAGYA